MRTSTHAARGTAGRPERERGRLVRTATAALVASLVAGLLGIVAVTAVTVTPDVAGASTTAVAATWSPTPACNGTTYATASPPAGALSATVVLNGAGGGGGGHGSGTGGTGAKLTGTFNLTHATGSVAVNIGCGGAGGGTVNPVGCCSSQTVGGGGGGAAVDSGFSGGNAQVIDAGLYPGGSGGGGGGGSRLCLGTTSCTTQVADAGGGGGSGGSGNNTSSGGAGGGGGSAGASGSSGGGGGAAGTSSSTGSAGGNSGNNEVSGGGGGGGGGAGPGNGGGGCGKVSGSCGGGGGGGGFSKANASYYSSAPTVTVAGGAGGGQQAAGTAGSVSLTWNVDNLSVTNPGSQSSVTGSAISALAISAAYDTTGGNTVTYAATGLPAGLSISPSTGAITGTPTTPGSSSVTVTVTDSQALSTSTSFTWTTTNTVTVANPGAKSSVTGTAISAVTNSATDSQSGATLTWSATGLPAGLSISPTTGTVTGTPTTPCTCSVTVKATDGAAFFGTASFSWTVTNTVTVANPGAKSSVTGTAITAMTNSATDSQSGATLTWSATGLPAGLSINPTTGTVTGTPTTPCSCSVTLTATDGAAYSGSATFTWTVTNTVAVANPGARSSVTGTAISPLTMTATDSQAGVSSYTWSATGLPAGLSINTTTGSITGTPTTPCTCSVTVTAADPAAQSGTASFSWTVTNTVTVANPGAKSSLTGTAITAMTNSATDSQSGATLTWSATGLPAGLSINPTTGTVTGTPTTPCTCSVTVQATDGAAFFGTATFSWTVTNTVAVANPGARSSVTGSAIAPLTNSATDSQSGATLTWSATGLPAGLSINPTTGTVSGTPTTPCTCSVTLTATDASSASGGATFTWTVTNTVTVTGPGARTDVSGAAIADVVPTASDSSPTATLTWSATGLPAGLSINATTGHLTGTPTTGGASSVTVTATDGSGASGSATFLWTITDVVTVTGPGAQTDPAGAAISPLGASATDSSSTATLTWSATGLPVGLSIDPSTGVVSGTPTTAGTSSVTLTATDGAGYADSASFAWTITSTVTVTGPGDRSDPSGTPIVPLTLTATDSSSGATVTWSATGLPAGLSLGPSSGVVSGTPTTGGTVTVTVTATDGFGATGSTTFAWTVVNTVSVTSPGDRSDVAGTPITPLTLTATDSSTTATVTWSATGLPAGLSLDAPTGVVSGTPTADGVSSVTVTATDGSGATDSATFTWTVTDTIALTSPGDRTDDAGTPIVPLALSATDSSSTATVTFSGGGTLPAGLSLDGATGMITGTPTTGGPVTVTLSASDASGATASVTFTWTIVDVITPANLPDRTDVSGTAVTPVDASATDSSTVATLAYTDGGTLPPGLTVDPSSGSVTGTPTTAGTYTVTLTATDDAGYSGHTTLTWTITNTVLPPALPDRTDVSGTAITPVAAGATDSSTVATLAYTDGGTLPPGLSIDPSSGSITGTPTTAGTYTVTLTATDNTGYSATDTFTWRVTDIVTVTAPTAASAPTGSAITPLTLAHHDTSSTATLASWSAAHLPPGLAIDTGSGAITGTPTTAGNYFGVTVTATDSAGFSGSAHFEWRITNVITVSAVADQATTTDEPATPVTPTATDSQVTPAVTLSWSAAGLPPGITVNHASGQLSGTPTASGTYPVTVTAQDDATPRQSGSTSFTWTVSDVAPTVTGLSPTTGPGAGGTVVRITGTHLQDAAAVSFGGTPAVVGTVNSTGTQVTVTSPVHATGTVDVTVAARGLTSATSTADRFTFAGPVITSLSVTAGAAGGGAKVKIHGTGLTGATSVTFGGAPATGVKANKSGTLIVCTSPAHAPGTVDVIVATPGGTTAAGPADHFTYLAPSVTSVTPSTGRSAGGTKVTIAGTGLKGATAVSFGSVPASTYTINAAGTRITVTAPPGAPGTVDITVTTPGGTSATVGTDHFTYG